MPVAADSLKVCTLRRSVESALRNRRTRVVIVDEAHHILMCRDEEMQKYAFEQLKSLTDETGIVLILVGTYDLLDIRDHSGQLMRRSEIVHLKRYCYNELRQKAQFATACKRIRKAMAIPLAIQEEEMVDYLDICQLKSAGAVGILVELHLEAQRRALEAGMDAVSLDLLTESAKPNTAILTILEEALRGEERLNDVGDEDVRTLLEHGLAAIIEEGFIHGKNPDKPTISIHPYRTKPQGKRKTRRRIGIRNAVRDIVGSATP
jgi:hypothetical protein